MHQPNARILLIELNDSVSCCLILHFEYGSDGSIFNFLFFIQKMELIADPLTVLSSVVSYALITYNIGIIDAISQKKMLSYRELSAKSVRIAQSAELEDTHEDH